MGLQWSDLHFSFQILQLSDLSCLIISERHHHDGIHSQISSLVKQSWSWSELFRLCIPPHVCIHTEHNVNDKKLSMSRVTCMSGQWRCAFFPLTTGARVRKSRCLHRSASAAQGRRSLPGGWPWQGPPSYYCSVYPGCCRTAAGSSLCPGHLFWAQICPAYGAHPWPPCSPC